MSKIVKLHENRDVVTGLRNIADEIEALPERDEIVATVIIGNQVYCVGGGLDDAQAAGQVIFDCNLAIHKLMKAAME